MTKPSPLLSLQNPATPKRKRSIFDEPLDIKIDRGIPIPKPAKIPSQWPIHQLDVGDSMFIPGRRKYLASNVVNHERNKGKKYTQRKWKQNGQWGIRIWRTK